MNPMFVFGAYGAAALLALLLLYFKGRKAWYWHLLSAAVAMGIGLMPTRPEWHTKYGDLAVGCAFAFLFLWGVAAPLFRSRRS